MQKRTKILATLGPASHTIEMIEGLIKAGANMFRLNFSHGSHEYHLETLNNIRTAMKNVGKTVGILQDISGPKVRIGDVKEPFELHRDDIITFLKDDMIGYKRGDKDNTWSGNGTVWRYEINEWINHHSENWRIRGEEKRRI